MCFWVTILSAANRRLSHLPPIACSRGIDQEDEGECFFSNIFFCFFFSWIVCVSLTFASKTQLYIKEEALSCDNNLFMAC